MHMHWRLVLFINLIRLQIKELIISAMIATSPQKPLTGRMKLQTLSETLLRITREFVSSLGFLPVKYFDPSQRLEVIDIANFARATDC